MFKKWKQYKAFTQPYKVRLIIALLLIFIIIGLLIRQFQFIMVILFVIALMFFIKQGEQENKQLEQDEQQNGKELELLKLSKKIEVLRDHVQKNEADIENKLKLAELEVEYEIEKNKKMKE